MKMTVTMIMTVTGVSHHHHLFEQVVPCSRHCSKAVVLSESLIFSHRGSITLPTVIEQVCVVGPNVASYC